MTTQNPTTVSTRRTVCSLHQKPVHPILEGLDPLEYPHPYGKQVDHLIERLKAQVNLLYGHHINTPGVDDTLGMGLDLLQEVVADIRQAHDAEFAHTASVWAELKHRLEVLGGEVR